MSVLRCENLRKSFGAIQALDGVAVEFPKSRITAIMGPNGAGKTTLINVVTGFVESDQGRCVFAGHETTRSTPSAIARLGLIRTFQDLRLIRQVSALENVLLAHPCQSGERLLGALFRRGVNREERINLGNARGILDLVGLAAATDTLTANLSYGQQKLLSIACLLGAGASTLLLDEPVAGLHPEMSATILRVLQELRKAGKSIIFVEHNVDAIRQIAEEVVVMDQGRIIAQGTPVEVLARPEIAEAYLA